VLRSGKAADLPLAAFKLIRDDPARVSYWGKSNMLGFPEAKLAVDSTEQ
jgi:hypothetical protein